MVGINQLGVLNLDIVQVNVGWPVLGAVVLREEVLKVHDAEACRLNWRRLIMESLQVSLCFQIIITQRKAKLRIER